MRESLSLLTPEQVCELLQVDVRWLYKQVQANRFPHRRVGKYLRFMPAEVQAYIEGDRPKAPAQPEPQVPTAPRRGRPRKAS